MTTDPTPMTTARLIVEVQAGVIPGKADPVHTRRFAITSQEWNEAGEGMSELLARINGQAQGYAGFLMLQPHVLNWVRTEWLWL